ncbi:hypothetical protein DYB30_007720 [Aphanomyces astaci]|uniref:C2 domain-containing protein n=2 Tax=Aphanomyces astaci TaxID=112090 RepID=A0A397DDF4_APHAT|nr:hypothetical protein DYB36_008368 [Aphanomyces astaci]RHY49449.1 hypothetical protein DYB34_013650 [Aphanomyces astaci]RHY59533.1 hypothetical protein DYB38_013642 [Aphanomyces astaci]RHY60240.1 hypothetical protein DYB30_007720 [Aphanomyces astaci]RHZ31068.1 hypothetical protein DYB26_012268 [Aphanomyces astaci]
MRQSSSAASSFGGNLSRSSTSFSRHILRVQLHKATDLAAGDFSLLGRRSSDPYVVFTVGKEKYKSAVISKTLAPVWSDDAVFEFHVTDGDLFTKVLDVQVFDQDNRSDDLLATLALPLAQFATPLPFSSSVSPREKSYSMQVPAAFAKQKVTSQIFLTIHLMADGDPVDNPRLFIPRQFKITLHKATDLPAADYALFGKGKSDPYVVFAIGSQRFKSDTISKCLDPVWTSAPTYEFDLTQDDLFTQVLDIQVFDSDHGLSADDLIGTLSIPLAQFDVVDAAPPRMRPYLLNVPDQYHKQNVHAQLFLTLDMAPLPFSVDETVVESVTVLPPDLAALMEAMQAEIAALKLSSQGMVQKMEADITPTIAVASSSSDAPSQPEPVETEGDGKKRALVNELHGLLKIPPIKTFTKLQVASTSDGAALQWQNEVEHLKTQLEQQKRLNEMLAAQDSSSRSDKDEVERLKHEVAVHKATLQAVMEEQMLRDEQTQKELKILKSISAVKRTSSGVTSPPSSPRAKSTSDGRKDDDSEDESLWL